MFSKTTKKERIDSEQREQYEYARKRIKQKKRLMQHFIFFLAGSVLIIIINPLLGYGDELLVRNWYIWAILIWGFILLIHAFNVFVLNKFMGKEWEDRQLEKLKIKQAERITQMQRDLDKEVQLPKTSDFKKNEDANLLPPDVQ